MIIGIGTDLLETTRLAPATLVPGDPFHERAFTPGERAQAEKSTDPLAYLRGRFCAKEAIYKAVSQCREEFHPGEIEVLTGEGGLPTATLSGRTLQGLEDYLAGLGLPVDTTTVTVHVSISHETTHVSAFALAEASKKE